MAIDWNLLAAALDFGTPEDMLLHLYHEEKKTTKEIGDYLGVSASTVIQQMTVCHIRLRPKGTLKQEKPEKQGPGRGCLIGEFVCRWCGGTFWGDKRRKCCDQEGCREREFQFAREKWVGYRKAGEERRKNSVKNPCKICGKDRGKNYYFCQPCLSLISVGRMFLE